jgi:glycosyltransferase involved in cell wall biosynthesis
VARRQLSVVIPVYRNLESLEELIAQLAAIAPRLPGPLEVVFTVDGSPDASFEVLRRALPGAPFTSQLVLLSRNFGAFQAVRAGLSVARGEHVAVMAADLQEPPELLVQFFEQLAPGDCDVVLGQRAARADPLGTRVSSSLFWGIYRRLVQPDMPAGGIDVFACTTVVKRALLDLQEANSSLVGLLIWMGFRRRLVPYERRARKHGRSAWGLRRRWQYLKDSVFAFSDVPIRLLGSLGLLSVLVAVGLALAIVVNKLLYDFPVQGYAALITTVLFYGGLNMVGLSIVGEYLWRTFENSKRRPSFLVLSLDAFPGSPA